MAEEADKDVSFTMLRHFLPGFGPFFWSVNQDAGARRGFLVAREMLFCFVLCL